MLTNFVTTRRAVKMSSIDRMKQDGTFNFFQKRKITN